MSPTLLPFASLQAQFVPIPLTPESFNHDVVVERSAPAPVRPATTASVDAGLANTGFSWFERGYHPDWPATGLPTSGSTVSAAFTMDHEYLFAPDYRTNNAVLINSALTHAELVLLAPAPFSALSFLLSGAHAGGSAPVAYSVHHADGSVESGRIRCVDWLDSAPYYAFTPNGRVNVGTFGFADLNANRPKLFNVDITLTNTSLVTSIELAYVSGLGNSVIMAVSGASEIGGVFSGIPVSGYNADMVVEASATRPQILTGATTATIASGVLNTLWTFYECGYVPDAPQTGLPAAGAMLTNNGVPGQIFQLPPSYTQNNAALLDTDSPTVNLTPASPGLCKGLAFLTASGAGPATNQCVLQHADGSAETNSLVSPDWTDASVAAVWVAGGRVNVNNRLLTDLNGSGPRLFAVELALANQASPVTNVLLQAAGRATGAHTLFFAMSGKTETTPPEPARLSMRVQSAGELVVESSLPGRLEYTTEWRGPDTVWQDLGNIAAGTPTVVALSTAGVRFYRVVRQ